jgi:REP element-mobilizing transposase RayT
VTARGDARQVIFGADEDYRRFVGQLQAALEADGVRLLAYVLMPNHYHLVVETPSGNIPRFMQRLNTAYGMYYRYKHKSPGHCFQGRYGAKLVSGDDYLIRVLRYVHLNPVKVKGLETAGVAERVRKLNGYAWSSYRGYVAKQQVEEFVDYRWLRLMDCRTLAGNRRAYRAYVEGFVGKDDQALKGALAASRYAIGDERFREEVGGELEEARMRKGVYGRDVLWPEEKALAVEKIEELVCQEFGVAAGDLRGGRQAAREAKKVMLELASRYSGECQRDIGRYLGYTSDSAVGKQRQVFKIMLTKQTSLRARFEKLCNKVGRG